MVTPPSGPSSPICGAELSVKRKASRDLEIQLSASPRLEEKKKTVSSMQRTPQSNLTQTKLTGMGVVQNPVSRGPGNCALPSREAGDAIPTAPTKAAGLPPVSESELEPMDESSGGRAAPSDTGSRSITAEFLLKALRENKEDIVKSFNANIGALSKRVEDNSAEIATNAANIDKNAEAVKNQTTDIQRLTMRVELLEKAGPSSSKPQLRRARLSEDYLDARRSARLWPIRASNDVDLWGEVGEFLHGRLGIPESQMCQDDIETVTRVCGSDITGRVNDEVIVKFYDKRKRDDVFANATHLASAVDGEGKPTAGIRLEVPRELEDTFRLLSRFGTRLRARHGQGTRRHVKFDDFSGSLFANVKLPGDTTWTRVTPAMAQEDLERSMKEESAMNQKRLASKLIPGPRERLNRPLPVVSVTAGPSGIQVVGGPPAGKRPRWSAPDRRQAPTDRL